MTDRYENIRRALEMGPTPESWAQDIDGDAADCIAQVAVFGDLRYV